MRKTIVLTLIGVAHATSATALSELEALSMIESGNNDRAVGSAGEVSRFQIKPHLWRRYSPNLNYRNADLARVVAGRMLAELEADFRNRARRSPTDFDRYVLWNAGPTYYARVGFAPGRVSKIVRERARRYANLREFDRPTSDRFQIATAAPSKSAATAAKGGVLTAQASAPLPVATPATQSARVATFLLEPVPAQMDFPAFSLTQPPSAANADSRVSSPGPRPTQGVLALGGMSMR